MLIAKEGAPNNVSAPPDERMIAAMQKFSEELTKAGVLLGAERLDSSSNGARVKFSGGKHTVIDGPFTESKELVAGFWLWQVRSKAEAIEWLKRAPFADGTEIEIRPILEYENFRPASGHGLEEREARVART
jgi:hypothetical protein